MNYTLIKQLLDSPGGSELKSFFFSELRQLESIGGIPIEGFDERTIAITLLGQQKAYKIVSEMLEKIISIQDMQEARFKDEKDLMYNLG